MAKILVSCADVDARDLIVFALRFAGHQMKSGSSVEECIDLARQFKPDLLLLDDTLPGLNGIEANQYLKAHEITASIPLILFTSNSGADSISDEKTGADDELILDSFSPDQLTDNVNSLVNRLCK